MFDWFVFGNRRSKVVGSDTVQKLGKGDSDTIKELYNLYFDRTYSMVYNQVGRNHDSAEEVTHETCLAAIKSANKFKGKSSPYIWICNIATCKINYYLRRSNRGNAVIQKLPTIQEIPELQLIGSSPLPDELIEKEETKEIVRIALDSLPSQYRQVLTLKYMEKMSMKEVGQVLGKSSKSVRDLLDRAKLVLRNELVAMSS